MAVLATAVGAGHVDSRAGLVEESLPLRVKRTLTLLPFGASLGDVRTILRGGVQRPSPRRLKNRRIELQVSIWRPCNRPMISSAVRSGSLAIGTAAVLPAHRAAMVCAPDLTVFQGGAIAEPI